MDNYEQYFSLEQGTPVKANANNTAHLVRIASRVNAEIDRIGRHADIEVVQRENYYRIEVNGEWHDTGLSALQAMAALDQHLKTHTELTLVDL